MAKDTRERILASALELFSQNGYTGTNIRELTASLGLVKSSMYKHFESKEEIWNSLLDELAACYDEDFASPERMSPVPDSPEKMVAMTMRLADLTIRNEKMAKARRLLMIEQFRDERAGELAAKYFFSGFRKLFTPIFQGLMDKGLLRCSDPEMTAFAYTAPISELILLCDREPEKTAETMAQIEAFSRHFMRVYGVMDNEKQHALSERS